MTALYTEGFETILDQMDLTARGLLQNVLYNNGGSGSVAIASRTGQPGKGLYLRGPYSTGTQAPQVAANYEDFGLIPMGASVYSLWQAGGFCVGFSASFNSQNFIEVAPLGPQQLCYDGAQYYWAIYRNTSTAALGVAYSSDLKNWTPTLSLPGTLVQNSMISVTGSGLNATVLVSNVGRSSGGSVYYSTNAGLTWSTMALVGTVTYTALMIPLFPAGPTGPAITTGWPSTTGLDIDYFSSITATPTRVIASLAPPNTHGFGTNRISNGYMLLVAESMTDTSVYPIAGETAHIAYCSTSNNPSVAGNWTTCPPLNADIADVAVFGNLIVAAGYGGFYYMPMSGTGANTWFASPSFSFNTTFTIFGLASNGTTMVAMGNDPVNLNLGAIYTSTDGIHWVKQNRFIYSNASNVDAAWEGFVNVLWDGARFVATGGANNGMIITSPDGLAWEVAYVTDYGETNGAGSLSFAGVYSGTYNNATGIFTPWTVTSGSNIAQDIIGLGVATSTIASNTRTVAMMQNYGNYQGQGNVNWLSTTAGAYTTMTMPSIPFGQQPGSALTHYYELIFTPAGVANTFTVQWAIDGQVQPYSTGVLLLAANNDTGATQLFFNLPRNGNFNVFDDIYLTSNNGQGNYGRLGPQSIFAATPANSVQSNFASTNASLTNPQVVNTELANAEGYLYATAKNTEDIYTNVNAIPANYQVKAVLVDAMVQSAGGSLVAGAVGVQSGSTSKTGTPVAAYANGLNARATLFMETDPNTSAPFTLAAINALDLTITRTT